MGKIAAELEKVKEENATLIRLHAKQKKVHNKELTAAQHEVLDTKNLLDQTMGHAADVLKKECEKSSRIILGLKEDVAALGEKLYFWRKIGIVGTITLSLLAIVKIIRLYYF